jgi:HlyD family secretion protein
MRNLLIIFVTLILASCSGRNQKSDAYGNFECVETIISAEAQGTLLTFLLDEGMKLSPNRVIGLIDTVPLHLKREQVLAQRKGANARLTGIQAQIDVQAEQVKNLSIEKRRVENLLKDKAIPEKQLDDLNGNIRVLESQITSIGTQKNAILAELEGISSQLRQLDDQNKRSIIMNPIAGTVLEKYVEPHELVSVGKPLYKIASLDTLIMRAFVAGGDLSQIKLGQEVEVLIDDVNNKPLKGIVEWISPEAEFTPKIIQTRKERINLVYAVKVLVPNDGRLKVGMPGEINFIKK